MDMNMLATLNNMTTEKVQLQSVLSTTEVILVPKLKPFNVKYVCASARKSWSCAARTPTVSNIESGCLFSSGWLFSSPLEAEMLAQVCIFISMV